MPVYDYLCANCRHITEVIHGIHEPGPRFCPSCGAEGTMRKAMSSPTVHFKGSGWAKKDRSSTSGGRSTKSGGSAPSTEGGSSRGSSSGEGTAAPAEPAKSSADAAAGTED